MKNGCLIWRHKKQPREFFLPVKATSIYFVWFIKTNDQVTHTGTNIISMYSVGLTGQHNSIGLFCNLDVGQVFYLGNNNGEAQRLLSLHLLRYNR